MPNSTRESVSMATEAATLLAKAEIERFKLKLAKLLTRWVTHLIVGFMILMLLLVLLIFLGMALSQLLQLHLTPPASYAIVAGIFGVLVVLVYLLRNRLIGRQILKNVLNELFDES